MPLNVICLNCTAIAFFFGSILNALVRKSDLITRKGELKPPPTKSEWVLLKLALVVRLVKAKVKKMKAARSNARRAPEEAGPVKDE